MLSNKFAMLMQLALGLLLHWTFAVFLRGIYRVSSGLVRSGLKKRCRQGEVGMRHTNARAK